MTSAFKIALAGAITTAAGRTALKAASDAYVCHNKKLVALLDVYKQKYYQLLDEHAEVVAQRDGWKTEATTTKKTLDDCEEAIAGMHAREEQDARASKRRKIK